MYNKAYGIIETLAPLHVGATAGEETGNLNLIFRDQFTQTGIIPGSSIRGRFRSEMYLTEDGETKANNWYGHEAEEGKSDSTTESLIKFEYASIVWLPVFCPNQPIVKVSCPRLLKRYQKITGKPVKTFEPYSYYGKTSRSTLFFNLGFLALKQNDSKLKDYVPEDFNQEEDLLLLVKDTEMPMIHDMALYRQTRVALEPKQKKAKTGAFFDVEALPEGTIISFPIAMKQKFQEQDVQWNDYLSDHKFIDNHSQEFYFGGLESIGFGRTKVSLHLHSTNKAKTAQ